jgi:hypothetical protein
VARESELGFIQAQFHYFALAAELRRELGKVICHRLTVVFLYGDMCLARVSAIIMNRNSCIDSLEIELLEYSPLIALDLSTQYLVQASLFNTTRFLTNQYLSCLPVHTFTLWFK